MGCTKSMPLIRPVYSAHKATQPNRSRMIQRLARARLFPFLVAPLCVLFTSVVGRLAMTRRQRQAQSEKRGTDRVTCVKNTKLGGPSAQPKPRPVLAHQEGWPTGQRLRASLPSRFLPPSLMGHGSCALGRTEWKIEFGLPPQI